MLGGPVVEELRVAQREAGQERAAYQAGRLFELLEQLFARLPGELCDPAPYQLAGSFDEAQVQHERTVLFDAEQIALDAQVSPFARFMRALKEPAQLEQGRPQGCTPVHSVQLWPERFGEGFARVQAAFYSQVDQQGQRLARGEGEGRLIVFYDRDAK
jgi:hypothetical protein